MSLFSDHNRKKKALKRIRNGSAEANPFGSKFRPKLTARVCSNIARPWHNREPLTPSLRDNI